MSSGARGMCVRAISCEGRTETRVYSFTPHVLTVIGVVMLNVNRDRRRVIRWGLVDRLEGLDFADVSCLLYEAYREMQAKPGDLTQEANWQLT